MRKSLSPVLFAILVLTVSACSSARKNQSGGVVHMPPAMACPVPTDPACTGSATAAVQIPLSFESLRRDVHALTGRCEVVMEGETTPRPCTDIRLVLQSSREGEERTAVVKGFNFRFENLEDLNEQTYRLSADSPALLLQPDSKDAASPGQTLKIRLKAKPRP